VLLLVQVQLPLNDAEADTRHYNDDHADIRRFGAASSKVIVLIYHSPVLCLRVPLFPYCILYIGKKWPSFLLLVLAQVQLPLDDDATATM
jgi:hypothetical protein